MDETSVCVYIYTQTYMSISACALKFNKFYFIFGVKNKNLNCYIDYIFWCSISHGGNEIQPFHSVLRKISRSLKPIKTSEVS